MARTNFGFLLQLLFCVIAVSNAFSAEDIVQAKLDRSSYVMLAGGDGNSTHTSLRLFTGTHWHMLPPLEGARQNPSIVAYNNFLMIAGGFDLRLKAPTNEVRMFDGAKWQNASSMNEAHNSANLVVYNGTVVALAGSTEAYPSDTAMVETYDGAEWKVSSQGLQTARVGAAAAVVRGAIYISGGFSHSVNDVLNTVERCDQSFSFHVDSQLNVARQEHAMVAHDDTLYVFGGKTRGDELATSLEVFNFEDLQWREVATDRAAVYGLSAFSLRHRIGVIGGETSPGKVKNVMQWYTPDSQDGTWEEQELPFNCSRGSVTVF